MPSRRFPPPWSVEELDACHVVRDHDGRQRGASREDGRRIRAMAECFKWAREAKANAKAWTHDNVDSVGQPGGKTCAY
jgi:hypothetical protein